MKPTSEQNEAVEKFRTGGSLKINAYAGTGKTTTLQLLAGTSSARGMYLAFNKSIAQEASEKFPSSVTCSTVHSLAFRATPAAYKRNIKKMTDNMNVNAFAEHLRYQDGWLSGVKITARAQAHLARETLRHFMQGGRKEIDDRHVPDLDHMGNFAMLPPADRETLERRAIEGARMMWQRMSDPSDPVPLGHDGYLKLWALSDPRLSADFILLDEAQDTNPVVLGVLGKQQSQLVYVGDRHQQIYEWRGAVNAMDLVKTDHSTYLTTSFRFGTKIAEAASAVLRKLDERIPLTGNPAVESFIGVDHPDAILARTNATVMSSVLEALSAGRNPHIVGGIGELIRMLNGVRDLKQGRATDIAEFFGFQHWSEVVEFSKLPEGEQIRTFVSLVESFGEERLISELRKTADSEKDADLIISTAHKAKGREWDCVRLAGDFMPSLPSQAEPDEEPEDEDDPQSETDTGEAKRKGNLAELRLFYVAMTRARKAIDIEPATLESFGITKGAEFKNPRQARPTPIMSAAKSRIDPTPRPRTPKPVPKAPISEPTPNRQPTEQESSGGGTIVWILLALAVAYFVFG